MVFEEQAPAETEVTKKELERDEEVGFVATDLTEGLSSQEVEERLIKFGRNEIPVPETPVYVLFLRQFTGFLPILIEIAALVSLSVQDYTDFGIILGILIVNAVLGFREEYHAKKSLEAVSQSLDSEVSVRRSGETSVVSVTELVPGDVILLVGGTVIPADVEWRSGDTMSIDTACMTGEPIPRKTPSSEYGNSMLSGTTVVAGECYAQVVRTATDTEIGKAQADILADKSVRVVSVFQQKIMTVVQLLVGFSLAVVLAVLLIKGLVYDGFKDDVRKTILDALAILIASIPVALPLVVQVNLALGASFLATQHHAIVTSIPALQDIASMSMLCSDKTGTLTTANMSVIVDQIFATGDFTRDQVILYAYLCSNADKKDDPIDKAIVRAYQESSLSDSENGYIQTEIIGFNPTVKRVVSFVKTKDGKVFTIAKGLPGKIVDTTSGGADDHELQWKVQEADDPEFVQRTKEADSNLSTNGYKTIAIAVCEGNARELPNPVWKFVGLVPMLDPPRNDTQATIESLHHANISIKMITGDHQNVGRETARLIGLGTDIRTGQEAREASNQEKRDLIWHADGFASVLPSDKREVVMTLRNEFGVVTGMTGDGVNDAPALSAAQVGIAVEGATDAAKNAADLILTEPGLSPIYGAVLESRRIFSRIKSYVVYRVAASIVMVLTLSILIFATGCAVDSLFIIILALVNDISMIPVAYDNCAATTKPQLPNAKNLVLMAMYYGFMQTTASLLILFGVDHGNGLEEDIELNRDCNSQTRAFVWLHLVMVTELLIFSVRAPSLLVRSTPSMYLFASVVMTCIGSVIIAIFGLGLDPLDALWIFLFNIGSLMITDLGKISFRQAIGEAPGEIIESDQLLEVTPIKTETARNLEKKLRYVVHEESCLPSEDRQHIVQVHSRRQTMSFFSDGTHLQGDLMRRRLSRGFLPVASASGVHPKRKKQSTMPW